MRYYHQPGLTVGAAQEPQFYEQVDPALRELCRMLHRQGIHTTASCEGHDHDQKYFEQRWEGLCAEAEKIKRGELVVIESQTGSKYRFSDPGYQLPWDNLQGFLDDSLGHQSNGYIGIVLPAELNALGRSLRKEMARQGDAQVLPDRRLSRFLNRRFYHLLIHGPARAERLRQWYHITEWFRGRLGH